MVTDRMGKTSDKKKSGRASGQGRDSSTSSKGKGEVKWTCLQCERVVDEEMDETIECGLCKKWCHRKCSKLNDAKYKYLQEGGDEILWSCQKCRESDSVDTGRTRLEAKLDSMMEMMERMMRRVCELEEGKSEKCIREMIDESVKKEVQEAMNEEREREKRKLNVILVNVPESEGENAEERKKADLERVREIVGKVADVEKEDIGDPVRLGARMIGKESKPRMLRVTMRNEEARKKVLMNARRLNEGVEFRKRVYINPDRTEGERRQFRELKEELERRKKEEPDLVIRGGKIVKKKTEESEKREEGGKSQ